MLMYAFICSINFIFLMGIVIILVKVALILRETNKNPMLSRKMKIFTILCRLSRKSIPQTTFALCVYLVSLFQYMDMSLNQHYCYGIISYVLPIIIPIECILSIY